MMDTRFETPVLEDIRLQVVGAKQHGREVTNVEVTREAYEALRLELIHVPTLPWETGLPDVYVLGLLVRPVSGDGSFAFVG